MRDVATGFRLTIIFRDHNVFERAREPKQMWLVEGGRHLDAFTVHGGVYRQRLADYLVAVVGEDD